MSVKIPGISCFLATALSICATDCLHAIQRQGPQRHDDCWICEVKSCWNETGPLSGCETRKCEGTETHPAPHTTVIVWSCETIGVLDPPPRGYSKTENLFEELRRPATDDEAGNIIVDDSTPVVCFYTYECGGCYGPDVNESTPCVSLGFGLPAGAPSDNYRNYWGLEISCRRVVATPPPAGL